MRKKLGLSRQFGTFLVFPVMIVLVMASSGFALDSDFLGIPRPQGTAIDVGACEYVSGQIVYSFIIDNPPDNFGVNMTNYESFEVVGRGNAGDSITVFAGNTAIGSSTVAAGNTWTVNVDFSAITEGPFELSARTTNGDTSSSLNGVLTKTYNVNAPRNVRIVE